MSKSTGHPTRLERLHQAISDFYAVASKYADYGASDSEPFWTFCRVIRNTAKGEEFRFPTTAEDWQLYTSSMSCGTAARALTAAARKVHNIIKDAPLSDAKLRTFAENYD